MNTIKFHIMDAFKEEAVLAVSLATPETVEGIIAAGETAAHLVEKLDYHRVRIWWESTETSLWGAVSYLPSRVSIREGGRVLIEWERLLDKEPREVQMHDGMEVLERWTSFDSIDLFLEAVEAAYQEEVALWKENEED